VHGLAEHVGKHGGLADLHPLGGCQKDDRPHLRHLAEVFDGSGLCGLPELCAVAASELVEALWIVAVPLACPRTARAPLLDHIRVGPAIRAEPPMVFPASRTGRLPGGQAARCASLGPGQEDVDWATNEHRVSHHPGWAAGAAQLARRAK
jgi:hypothetical protein